MQMAEFQSNYTSLRSIGGIKDDDDICTAAGMLFVAHQFRSTSKALEWRKKGELVDVLGISGAVYFNHGRHAIDVLSKQAIAQGQGSDPEFSGEATGNDTGLNTDDYFVFTRGGSGTKERFDSLNQEFKENLLKAAQEYKSKTGSKITITSAFRSQEEPTALYNTWVAAGGRIPGNPVVNTSRGRIITPAKGAGPHNFGTAIDSPQAELMSRTINLGKYGLAWGGNFTTPDPVHIQKK